MEGVGKGAAVAEARAWGLEVPAPPDIPRWRVRIPASLARFSSLKTIPACKFQNKEVGKHRDKTWNARGQSTQM